MRRDPHNKEAAIALLIWALGAVFLVYVTHDWDLPGFLGVIVGCAYLASLVWLMEAVHRHYRRREERDSDQNTEN